MSGAQGRISAGVGFNLIGQHTQERNQEATVYVGNLDPMVEEELLWELFIQAGPVVNMYVPKDRVTSLHQGYGFVEFRAEEDADYAIKVLNMVKLYGKPIRVNKATQDKKILDVGANLFVGNLDTDVDEKLLYDTFSAFGVIVATPKIMRDPDTGNSRGFGFISYDSFEAADAAIESMDGQYLCNKPITVTFAFKKDTKGSRHGTAAERLMAAQLKKKDDERNRPHTNFASGPREAPGLFQPPPPMNIPPPPPPAGMPLTSGAPPMAPHMGVPPHLAPGGYPSGSPGMPPPGVPPPGMPPLPAGMMPPPMGMPPPPGGMMPPPMGMPPPSGPGGMQHQGMPPPSGLPPWGSAQHGGHQGGQMGMPLPGGLPPWQQQKYQSQQ
mmetsp:Transcript_45553/g.87101  ORF Transcript_45553/g.87101 Transcript_45553/m.87101 type:complete len:382 (+) Transcript_45553:250-1395(+)|eukprot:CAMPEP_0114252178 /NCGR_PEP_ID=MMETSP0058-20121206/15692_1 /TAXON_ID=36894 /ORGANISM="Pyramimonas parkeae, CCMP726" /LENGTH=381 /DNA_ID=CAMNT_0001366083 /DNA_START=244 /DNA_END=1389 /DNA_ORIENTATION=-